MIDAILAATLGVVSLALVFHPDIVLKIWRAVTKRKGK